MEEFVVKWVWDIVQDRVDPNQYGSIKTSSITHALVDLCLLHQCYPSRDASKQCARILLLDFSKAFDLINHNILLQKIASFGIPNILMKWIASLLTERTQKSKLCNTQSDWNYIHGGVSQTTKLGPVLFVLMINEALANAQLTSLKQRRAQLCEHFFKQIEQPQHKLHKLLPKPWTTTHNTRRRTRYSLPRVKTNRTKICFSNWCLNSDS